MSKWIKKGDRVLVTTGNDKGEMGIVLSRDGDKVLVQGINVRKKHKKSQSRSGTSQILEIEMPVHISNVVLCNEDGSPIHVKLRVSAEGKKELYYTDGENEVVHRQIKRVK